jgi:hypothetical protein
MFAVLREFWVKQYRLGSESGPLTTSGSGSPEGVVTAPVGSLYQRTDGGTNTTLYRKESGAGNTGWVAISNAGGGGGSFAVAQATVDFGSIPARHKTFDVSVSGATVGQKVIASASLEMPGTVDEDELEMDMLAIAGRVSAADTVRLIIAAIPGPITGQRNINITVG